APISWSSSNAASKSFMYLASRSKVHCARFSLYGGGTFSGGSLFKPSNIIFVSRVGIYQMSVRYRLRGVYALRCLLHKNSHKSTKVACGTYGCLATNIHWM